MQLIGWKQDVIQIHRGADKRSIYQKQFFESIDVIPDITVQLYDINSKHLYMSQDEKKRLAKIFASWSHREQCAMYNTWLNKKVFNKLQMS
ncbi:hypothetical protein ATY39_07720 [Rummeliibacillus stabekisii]|uniref:Uncharacterized protein n=1 Tax=Rummeliibacillus stabekisii TaxID=241244 RepID=A0A143HC95_9BACL|nr:hypothetical protein ATY39_07720 [Rummeliibacillus stabekisii]